MRLRRAVSVPLLVDRERFLLQKTLDALSPARPSRVPSRPVSASIHRWGDRNRPTIQQLQEQSEAAYTERQAQLEESRMNTYTAQMDALEVLSSPRVVVSPGDRALLMALVADLGSRNPSERRPSPLTKLQTSGARHAVDARENR